MGVIRKIETGKLFSNLLRLFLYFLFIFYLGKNVQKCQKKGQFWSKWTKDVSTDGISLEGIESTRTAGSLMKLVFLELRFDNLQNQLPELVGQGFK